MCGSSENGVGIIVGLIGAVAILVLAYAGKHTFVHATTPAPAQHTTSAPAMHVALQLAPVTLDFDLATARVSVDVRL